MSDETTKSGKMGEWGRLLAAVTTNQADLAELENSRARLETVLGQVEQLAGRQAAHAAGKQEATKLLKEAMAECQRAATYLRHGLKQHYGADAEKLTEFGVQPFRGRPRNGSDEQPTEGTEAPAPAQNEASFDIAGGASLDALTHPGLSRKVRGRRGKP